VGSSVRPERSRGSVTAPTAGPRSVPSAFLSALALFFLLDHLLWASAPWLRVLDRYSPAWRSDALVTAGIALLPRGETRPPILLLGSSQIREGVDCGPFEARFPGRTCRNLAVSGGAPLDLLYLARRLDSAAPGRVIVTSVFPRTLNQVPKDYFMDSATLLRLAGSGVLSKMSLRDRLDLGEAFLMNVSETLRTKDALRAVWGVVRRHPLEAWNLALPARSRRLGDRLKEPPEYFERELAKPHGGLPTTFVDVQAEALDAFVAGEHARGNLLLVVDFPTRSGFETMVPPRDLERYRSVLERLEQRRDVILVRRGDLPDFGPEDWNDFTHLADSGMQKMSARLAEIVEREERR
jgi:hypothetical protein